MRNGGKRTAKTLRISGRRESAAAISEAVVETIEQLKKAGRPVILAGVEVHRRGLQDILSRLVLNACIPVAATLTGKSVVDERHAAYLGVFEAAMGPDFTRECAEGADVLLIVGATAAFSST